VAEPIDASIGALMEGGTCHVRITNAGAVAKREGTSGLVRLAANQRMHLKKRLKLTKLVFIFD
jgi:hypothetical protein